MKRTKKILLGITVLTLILIVLMSISGKVFAEDKMPIGSKQEFNLRDLRASDNLYCVAREKQLLSDTKAKFTVESYIEIEGDTIKDARVWKTKDGKKQSVTPTNVPQSAIKNEDNAILAAILGGALQQGYREKTDSFDDVYRHYKEAQIALWGHWNTWQKNVGKYYNCQAPTANAFDSSDISNYSAQNFNKYFAKATAAARKTNYHVKIYFLQAGAENWQDIIYVETFDNNTPPDENPPGQTNVTGQINISGYVWEDIADEKKNSTINSKYANSDGDLKVEGIKVHWKDQNGKEIASTTTDKNGAYKFSTTITLYNHPYGRNKDEYDKVNNSYIEFEYNGLKYTTVHFEGKLSEENCSRGKENTTERTNLDNKFDRVENQAIYDGNSAIISGLPNAQLSNANYTPEFAVSASTKNITTKLMEAAENNNWTEKKEFCVDHCQIGEGPHTVKVITTEKGSTVTIKCDGSVETKVADNEDQNISEIIKNVETVKGDAINTATGSQAHYYSAGETDGPTTRDCLKSEQEVYVWNINNMNLGLIRREQPDAALTSDIEKVRVIMKNQEYTYIYGNRGIQNDDSWFDYTVRFGNKNLQTYSRPVNPADIAYVNYNNTDDLKVYVTYDILLTNQSDTLPMTINSIVNYYDGEYSIYTGAGSSTSAGWQTANGENNGFKIAYNAVNITLQPKTKSDIIRIEFEVSQNKIKELQNEDTGFSFSNYTEITSYTTMYGANTVCSELELAETKERIGKQYAGIDHDSTPGNLVPGNAETYEDDTDRAPDFLLKKDSKYKIMAGVVYEDTQTEESKKNNERLGNGQKEDNEKGVSNVKVELLDADTGEIAYLYYKDASTGKANKKPAETYTDGNGKYSFGNEKESGVVVGNYIIKYTYGNADGEKTTIDGNEPYINARNYKSTIITDSNVKNVMQGNDSDKWYLAMDEGVDASIAVDDIQQRLTQETLKNSTYNNQYNMSAYSKKLALQIEYTPDQTAKVDENGGNFNNNCSVFDFGIIERPREDVVINKTISKIKITLGNGQVLIEGDPRKDNLNYVKPLGLEERQNAKFAAIDATKALSIEMDQELIQGATLEVWYSIMLTNNSEKDYEYATNTDYYNYGTNQQGEPLALANLVVDYMSESLICNVGDEFKNSNIEANNADWFRSVDGSAADADYLKNNGYISYKLADTDEDQTYETIKNNKLQSIVTNTFANVKPGETKTSVLYASKLLANQDENNLFENHVEIIELNSKTGRTIKGVSDDTRAQLDKEYQPGNYIPNLSAVVHQQDDDNVRITITPPTGIKNYTTIYIISAVVGLVVIAGGIVLIRKRFMK